MLKRIITTLTIAATVYSSILAPTCSTTGQLIVSNYHRANGLNGSGGWNATFDTYDIEIYQSAVQSIATSPHNGAATVTWDTFLGIELSSGTLCQQVCWGTNTR